MEPQSEKKPLTVPLKNEMTNSNANINEMKLKPKSIKTKCTKLNGTQTLASILGLLALCSCRGDEDLAGHNHANFTDADQADWQVDVPRHQYSNDEIERK
jgi:hypothetical protein